MSSNWQLPVVLHYFGAKGSALPSHVTSPAAVASEKSDSCISVVQPAEDWMGDNVSEPFDRARAGCILPE